MLYPIAVYQVHAWFVTIQVAQLKMLAYKNNNETSFPIYDGMDNSTDYLFLHIFHRHRHYCQLNCCKKSFLQLLVSHAQLPIFVSESELVLQIFFRFQRITCEKNKQVGSSY